MQMHVPANILVLSIAEENDTEIFVYAYMYSLFLLARKFVGFFISYFISYFFIS